MNIIFLDIDGVLNSERAIQEHYDKKGRVPVDFIDNNAMQLFNNLCEDVNAKVVITSTWRLGISVHKLKDKLKNLGATFEIIGVTPDIGYARGIEIKKWIDEHMYDTFMSYVIIDDDSDMLLNQAYHFFHVDNYNGITINTCYKIKRFFNKITKACLN